MPTPLQKLVMDAFLLADQSEGWAADRVLEHITEPAMVSALHRVLKDAGVEVEVVKVEACNHPIVPGSFSHHNQPDCRYRMTQHLVIDGQPLAFVGFRQVDTHMEVLSSTQDCVDMLTTTMRADHPSVAHWHVIATPEDKRFTVDRDYLLPIQNTLVPALAELRAQQIEQATATAPNRSVRSRL